MAIDDTKRQSHRDSRIDRIPASAHCREASFRRERVNGSHRSVRRAFGFRKTRGSSKERYRSEDRTEKSGGSMRAARCNPDSQLLV